MKRAHALIALLVIVCLLGFQTENKTIQGKVVAVLDGDTIDLLDGNNTVRIRLNGIDAPEKSQAYGQASKKYASQWLFGKHVRVRVHNQDKYGRSIGDVYVGEDWFNYISVANGFAWHYKQYSKDEQLADAEALAKAAKLGLWKDNNPTPPWEWRKSKKDLVDQ
ncbi:MAG: thermonuclease family protein [Cytophagales bacterium]|nr:thermonuclease family protein [Cytophagales bacterium]